MNTLKNIYIKIKDNFWELFWYGIFGVLTTVVNTVVYWVFDTKLALHYMVANIIAWVVAVAFAFVTNKLFVFKSKSWATTIWIKECISFVGARIATGFVDMGLMYVMISVMAIDKLYDGGDILAKIITNILVIILNFVFSKLFVFKKKK